MDPNALDLQHVSVVGAGSWGTALASLLAEKSQTVTLWCREAEVARGINETRVNPLFVSEHALPSNIRATTRLQDVARNPLLVVVVPAQFTRPLLESLRPIVRSDCVFISASKGIDVETLQLISDLYRQVFGQAGLERTCFLSGPSFARDVLAGLPTAVALAGFRDELLQRLQHYCSNSFFRIYRTDDVVGLELGGALKNVIALGAGISDGLGFGHSARAALITRGLAEMIRLGGAMGALPSTFAGLSGLGDLLLTATSENSRNRSVGYRIGRGESLEKIHIGAGEVAEGVRTAQAVYHLARKHAIDMPIANAVYEILHENRPPRSVVSDLMQRDLKGESR
ncbi:MAG: Glycerol-3-phosphate dehydrogenase [NAD(P)+] [Magnetococcales bacterium]|nr:Glycerol-3-phosphate dehydrogenase [NAD(P)+] [Magnetococcales bacterium]HIJ83844.1 NAD(P)-dependent glycerol-3-phosphate dehydrogenase [Magnetococcales bacterium]